MKSHKHFDNGLIERELFRHLTERQVNILKNHLDVHF